MPGGSSHRSPTIKQDAEQRKTIQRERERERESKKPVTCRLLEFIPVSSVTLDKRESKLVVV